MRLIRLRRGHCLITRILNRLFDSFSRLRYKERV